jgi:hypothetical protein
VHEDKPREMVLDYEKPSMFYSKDVNLGVLAKINVVSLETVTEVI